MPSPRISKFENTEIYFVTFTVIDWMPIFTNKIYFDILIENLKIYSEKYNASIMGYVIMTNHIHLLIKSKDTIKFIQNFKSFTTRELLKHINDERKPYLVNSKVFSYQKIWQRTNMPILIYSDRFFNQKLNYIHNNPVEKGYVEAPEDWIYSSARNYMRNDQSIIFVDTEYC
jgi:REP element-mobilizing transposase RayT